MYLFEEVMNIDVQSYFVEPRSYFIRHGSRLFQ